MKIKLLIAVLLIVLPSCLFSQGLTYDEQIYDFGHVGIDFKIQNNFIFVNRTDVPIKILKLIAGCDCTTVRSKDTLVAPGDTATFKVTFNTKDFYGPVNKSFSVLTDHPTLGELEYFYVSIVGQWFNGIKPNPISLFFLPTKKSQIITIPNRGFDNFKLIKHLRNDTNIQVEVIKESADKNDSIELRVSPSENLKNGTFKTSITLFIENDDKEVTILTIPIKIVKY